MCQENVPNIINGIEDQKGKVNMKCDPSFTHIHAHKREGKEICLNVDNGSIIAGDLYFSSLNLFL